MINLLRNLRSKSFPGGLHIKDYKYLTENLPIKRTPLPSRVRIPVCQHIGQPAVPIVKAGDEVKTGTLIASASGPVSSNIHSSITGKVTAIDRFPVPTGGEGLCIEITGNGSDEMQLGEDKDQNTVLRVRNAGIVGMGGAMFPSAVKLQPPGGSKIDTVIVNGAECEPFINSDYRLMIEEPDMVLAGLKICMETVGAERAYIGIESNKPRAIGIIKEKIAGNGAGIKVVTLKTKYPQGGEKQLIKAILNKEVPEGGLPFNIGVLVQNIGTVVAVYEAIRLGKPLYERIVTVTGFCVREPANWKVRIGTSFNDLIKWSGGLRGDPAKLIMGGPMMGLAQYTYDVPVIKGTNGILVLDRKEVVFPPARACIRCARCIQHCPMGLNPGLLANLVEKERWEEAGEEGIKGCMECGLCAYLCGSGRDIIQLIKYGKKRLEEIEKNASKAATAV